MHEQYEISKTIGILLSEKYKTYVSENTLVSIGFLLQYDKIAMLGNGLKTNMIPQIIAVEYAMLTPLPICKDLKFRNTRPCSKPNYY